MLKLDLGAGAVSPAGFTPRGNAHGSPIYPLPYGAASVDEIRASHVLEHFPTALVPEVLAHWVSVLKPGGCLRIAVPDFAKVAEGYLAGANQPTEGYVLGGQVDAADFHKSLFDGERLKKLLAGAGLMLIRAWQSELVDDCAALPISLNLEGTKPHAAEISVSAVMSVPRLGFMDNFFSAFEALPALKVTVRRVTGAFWGQCLERAIEEALEQDEPDAILTLDYDTVFSRRDAALLMQLMCCHPEADAIAAVQAARGRDGALFSMRADGERVLPGASDAANTVEVHRDVFAPDLAKLATAHFGLTLIRADKLRALPHPWFHDQPAADGGWGDGRTDADVFFWRQWERAGFSLYQANRVPVGHLDLSVRWPGADLGVVLQPASDWRAHGAPQGVWR